MGFFSGLQQKKEQTSSATTQQTFQTQGTKSAYQQNLSSPVETQNKTVSTRDVLGMISKIGTRNQVAAQTYFQQFQDEMSRSDSQWYNPYIQPTNRAVSNLAALGFDTNNLNDNWWNQNQGWVSSNLLYNGTTNSPSKPGKKSTRDQNIAYELYQWHKSEETTRKAEKEWQALQDELSYWAKDTSRNYSDDQIYERVYGKDGEKLKDKYPTLYAMNQGKKNMELTELNRAVDFSTDAMYGVMWAARNPEYQGNIWGAMANSALGTGNQWSENPEITAKLNENDDNTYSPYSVGMTLEQEGLYFNTLYFDQEMIDEIKKNLDWNDKTAKEMINNVQSAEDFTVKAEGELANLNAKINDWLDNDKYTEKDIMDLVDKYMSKECKSLLEMDKQLRSRTPSATTRAIDYKYDELKQRIHDRAAERDAKKPGIDAMSDELDAVTTAAPKAPSTGLPEASTGNPNYFASGGMSDAGIKMPSQQERDVYKAQDTELRSGLAAVDGELKSAESAQMKNAGTVSWLQMKEIWHQATRLPVAVVGLAQRNATEAAKTYVEGSMAAMRIVDNYTSMQSKYQSNQQRYDELHTMLGDLENLNQEIEPKKTITIGDFNVNMEYRAGDPEKGIAPDYVVTSAYAPGLGGGEDLYEIVENPEAYNENVVNQANDILNQIEEERKQAIADATKIEKAHYVYDSYGENAEALLNEYRAVSANLVLEEQYLKNNEQLFKENTALLNNVTKHSDLVRVTNNMLGVDTTKLQQAQAITGYLEQFYDEPPLYNSSESMNQYYDRMFGEAGDAIPSARSEWFKMNIDYIDRQLGYLDMAEEWVKENEVKLPDNFAKNMQYTRQDLENKRTAYEYAAILSDTDPKEMESAIAAGKTFEDKYPELEMHYWTNLFNDSGDYYTLSRQERYNLPDEGFDRSVVTEEDENLYYYLLGKKVLEMGGDLDKAIEQINTNPELTHDAIREVFSDAKKFQQFMEDENTGFGLWSIREYENSVGMGEEMVDSGVVGAGEANAMATLVTPAESIANIYAALDYAISGKRFNPKSFTARFSGFKEKTRAETRQAINDALGEDTLAAKIANLGYEIYCNRGDSLMNSMVFGSLFHTGIGMADEFLGASPMGATAAMNAAYQAIENGASTEQAWLIAGATFLAETATEAITLSNIKEAMGFEGELTGDSFKGIVKDWLTKSGVEEMFGESANDVIENYAQQLAQNMYDNPNYRTDHDNLVAKYIGEGMGIDEAEAAASRDEIKGVLHTALVSYLSAGSEVIIGGAKAAYNSYQTAKSQTKDTDQSAISKMYENWQNRNNDEVSKKKEEAFAKEQEQREKQQEAAISEQQKGYATDIEVLETAIGINDASARSAAMAAALVTENDNAGNDQANAAAVHVEDVFENGAQDVQEIMYGGMVNDQNMNILKRGIQYAALGGENSACYQLVQSDEFKAADPATKAQMLAEVVPTDMWNAMVNKNAESLVRENRIAEKEKELIANGALQGTKTAAEAVTKAEAEARQAQADLEVKQGEAESAQQALDAAVTENNENPSDENAKQVISASVALGQRDESAQQYEQHKAKLDAALEKAEAACEDTKQKELAKVRQDAEQIINEEDQQRAEEKSRIAEQERLDAEVRKKAFEEQQLNNNISRMDADDFISQYYPDATDEEKKTIRNAFVQARFEMGYTAQGFLQRKSFANAIEQKFGFKIKVGDTTEGGKVARKNAQIDKNTGTITLDTHATLDDMFYAILPHEVTHGAEKSNTYSELADAVLQGLYGEDASYEGILKAMENGDMSSQIAQDILAKKRLYDSKVGGNHTYREMAQEVVADGVGKILSGDQEAMDRLVAQKPSVAKRILNSIKNFLRKAAGFEAPSLTQAQQIADLLEQKLKDAGFANESETKESRNTRYSIANDYDNAIRNGNMESARNDMLNYAENAGYTDPVFHGSNAFGFTEFDPGRGEGAVFVSYNNSDIASTYTNGVVRDIASKNPDGLDSLSGDEIAKQFGEQFNRWQGKDIKDVKFVSHDELAKRVENNRNLFTDPLENQNWWSDVQKNNTVKTLAAQCGVNADTLMQNAGTPMELENAIYSMIENGEITVGSVSDMLQTLTPLLTTFSNVSMVQAMRMVKGPLADFQGVNNENGSIEITGADGENTLISIDEGIEDIRAKNGTQGGIYQLLARPGKQLVIDANGDDWQGISTKNILNAGEFTSDYAKQILSNDYVMTQQLVQLAKEEGFDSVRVDNIVDKGRYGTEEQGRGSIGIFLNPNDVKSADTVTYDDQGEVIPLEERFNESNNDIRYSVATESAIVQDEDGTPLAQEFDDGTAVVSPENFQYSLSSFDEDEQERVRQALLKKFPKDDVDKYMKDALGVACMIALDKQRLDFEASDNQVFLKPNNDYYFTLDASTLCAKRLLYQGTFDYVQHALPDEVFTPEDLIDLVNIMNDMGYETPCGICYVESRRRWLDTYAQKFLDTLPEEGRPSIDDLTTSDGLEKLRHDDPDMYKKFVDAMNKKGTANPKVVQLRTEYRGDISKMTAGQIQKVKDIGGLRIQSFSDFETPHLLDMMQAVMDMSAAGLTSQAYTKVPNFAWVFGNTGIKINLSLIGKGTGLDENGNLVFDNREGMNFDEAMQIRNQYGKNVGTILVGINDDHIVAAMGDPRIDFIIPFHKSGWSAEELRKMPTLNNYNDYTDTQNERLIIGRKEDGSYETESFKKHKDRTKESFENFQPVGKNGYWEFDKSGEENARNYLKMCADAKRVPKFSQFLVDNGDGSFSLPEGTDKRSTSIREGYWKTLIDFKMYENDGYGRTNEDGTKTTVKGAAQTEVTPNINMEEAYRVLNEYKLGRQMPDQADGTKGRFIPMESNNDVPVATAAGDRYIELIKNRRAGIKPNAPGPDTLEADLPADAAGNFVNPRASAFGASQAQAVLGNTESEAQETGAAQQAAMAINPETGEAERVIRNSLPTDEELDAFFDDYIENMSAEELDQLAQELFSSLSGEAEDSGTKVSKQLEPENEDISQLFENVNESYKAALERGDYQTARKIIDKLAERAGYTFFGSHRTNAEFTVFDRSKQSGTHGKSMGDGFYIAKGEGTEYDDDYYGKNKMLLYVKPGNSFDIQRQALTKRQANEVYEKYFAPHNSDMANAPDSPYRLHVLEKLQSSFGLMDYIKQAAKENNTTTDKIFKWLGYDSIKDGPQLVVFDPEQIKSFDLATYDDNSELINADKRFDKTNPDIRYSLPSDAPYLSAVNHGDMDEAQRMVDEKAKEAGYTKAGYHGTLSGGFTIFDKAKAGIGGNSGAGFYFSSNPDDSEANYSEIEGADNWYKANHLADKILNEFINNDEDTLNYEGYEITKETTDEELVEIAKKILTKNPQTYNVYLDQGKPYIRDFDNSTNLIQEAIDNFYEGDFKPDDYDSEEDYADDIAMRRSDEIYEAISNAVYNGIADVDSNYEIVSNVNYDDIIGKLAEIAIDYETLQWRDLIKVLEDQYIEIMTPDMDESTDGSHEIARAIVEAFGFDSIEDREVSKKFNQLKNMGNAGDTVHYIMFHPEQIKLADPVTYRKDENGNDVPIPLSERFKKTNNDIRYSLPSENILNDQIRYYLENQNAPQTEIPTITQQLNPAEETKQRQWGREGAQQSDELAEQAKQYVLAHNEYYPDTNAEQIDRAIEWIRKNRGGADTDGYYTSLQKVTSSSFNYRSADGQAKMIAVMGMAVAKNDVAGQVQLANLYNKQGTTLGQALQARKMWKLMTPEGRVQSLNNMLKVAQDDLNAKGTDVELKLSDWIYMAATAATQDGSMEAVRKAAAKEIAQQIPANWRDKMRSWRMLSMLGNPRTHIRNVIGNAMFIPAVGLKNKIGAIGEIMYNKANGTTERTKTLSLFLDKDIRNFAREDAVKMKDTLTGEAKYNENNAVQKEQKAFKGLLQAVIDYNSNKLESEDWRFLKGHYRRALGGWMQANGYTVEQLQKNPSLLEKGRAYAIEEAQKATYRDFNKLAATLNKVSRDGGVAGFLVDAALPFKKTPANILKRGIEYSPVGLMKSVTSDLYHLKQWKDAQNGKLNAIPEKALSPTQFVDRLSSGLSGSVVLGIGALLASAGIITCGLDDDDDEFEKAKGAQKYAIKILGTDVTFTIDWAAPMSMPLFVGASLYDQFTKEGDFDIEALVDAFGNITEPVFNLSMLDGVNSLFKTSQYDDTNTLTQIFAKIGSNYVTSYVPSALGAATRTFFDDTQRKAFVESGKGTGVLGTARYAIEQVENKIPGLSRTNIPIRDIWGNANTSSFFERLVENFISPGYFNEYKDDPIINEMSRLYDLTGDSSLVPSDPNKSVTYNKQKYVLSAEQWDTYKERRGQTAQRLLGELINTADYKNASFEVQAEMIKNVLSYADKVGKSAIIPGYKMDDLGANPVLSITKDSKVDGYKDEMIKALNANDFETYATMIQALRDEKVADKDIKKKIGDTYRDKYKEAYRNKQNTVMAEIEDILDNTGFDFDYYDWQLQEDKKNKNSGGGGGGGRPSAIPERPASDKDWGRYMDELDDYWASYDFDRNDPTEQNYNGTIDLNDRQVVHNEDGSISTEYSFSFWDDDAGKEVLIPRVVNGRIVSEQEAKNHYYKTGEHLGMFDDWHDADEYAMMLHNRNNWYYNR